MAVNYTNINTKYVYIFHTVLSSRVFNTIFTYYHVVQYEFELVNMWSKSDDEEDASMKAVGKCGTNWRQHGMAPLWDTILIFYGPGTQIQYHG